MSIIQTYTGKAFDLEDPYSSEIDIEDIAHALSNICRFTGHSKQFYSVADHSVLVSHLVPKEMALAALLHDASEAYLGDVSSPLKRLLPNYKRMEVEVTAAIYTKLLGRIPNHTYKKTIKYADEWALGNEAKALLGPDLIGAWGSLKEVQPLPTDLGLSNWFQSEFNPYLCKALFMYRYSQLKIYAKDSDTVNA